MAFVDEFADMMADTLTCQAGTVNNFGEFTASGDSESPAAYIAGSTRLVRDASGAEVASSMRAIVDHTSLTPDGYRFTLPARFSPRTDLKAIRIDPLADEDGAAYQIVYFP